MFNTTHIHGPSGPSTVRVTVDEHRAPTDDSVRLLNEMQEKAIANVVFHERLESNTFKGTITRMHSFESAFKDNLLIRFFLNDEEYIVKTTIQTDLVMTREDILKKVYDEVAKAIAENLILKLAREDSSFRDKMLSAVSRTS